jgi:hypothetical protein
MKKNFTVFLLTIFIVGCDQTLETFKLSQKETASQEKKILKWSNKEIDDRTGHPTTHTGEQLRAYFASQVPSAETLIAIHSKPGEEQGVYLQEFPIGKQIRVTLTQVDNNLKNIGVVAEKTYIKDFRNGEEIRRKFPFRMGLILPQKKDVLYTLLTEMIEENGIVSDSIISVIYVPGNEINAMLTTDKKVYTSDESIKLKLINRGPTWLSHGVMYLLEKQENGSWVSMMPANGDWSWTQEGYTTTPERDYTQDIKLDRFGPGKYRISKDVGVEKGDSGATLTDTFEIIDKPKESANG